MKKGLMVGVMALMMPFMAVADIHKSVDTPENRAILTKVENAYNSMRTIKAKFAQFNSKVKDDLQTGDLYLSKPGKMRLVYDKGSPLEFYATDGYFIYHDKDLEEVTDAATSFSVSFSFSLCAGTCVIVCVCVCMRV